IVERGKVVPVDLDRFPTEGGPARRERLKLVRILGARALLKPVSVDDSDEVVEAAMAGAHGRFPVRPFLQFAVTENDEGSPLRTLQLGSDGTSDCDRKTVTERTGVGFDARYLATVGMAVERRQRLHEG